MRIGVDFDNTIVCYDALFHRIALERGLIPPDLPVNKSEVRNHLRRIGREPVWTEMQGEVYGSRMSEATAYPGVVDFFIFCRLARIPVSIISHKTLHPFVGEKHDLHQAARNWLERQGFFDPVVGLPREEAFFELTKEAKLARIASRGCTSFIDDLPELLREATFPNIDRILFDPNNIYPDDQVLYWRAQRWSEIWEALYPAAIQNMATDLGFAPPAGVTQIAGGGNNRVYLVVDTQQRKAVAKRYFRHPGDSRDRFASEHALYEFLWRRGVRRTPEPLAWNGDLRLGILDFIEGRKLRPEDVKSGHVDEAFLFISELNRDRSEAESLPVASEACFSTAQHLALVDRRIDRLEQIETSSEIDNQAFAFVRDRLRPTWVRIRESIRSTSLELEKPLPHEARILSPSDFGFHNALLAEDGKLRFLDFEYAGWDDPAKFLCDFFCQPQIPVPLEYWDRAVSALAASGFPTNARPLLPAYKIKWCCIMLNEFLRGDRERRGFAQGAAPDAERKTAQLAKAARALDDALQIWKSA